MTWTARFVDGPLDGVVRDLSDAELDQDRRYRYKPSGFTSNEDLSVWTRTDRARRVTFYELRENPAGDTDYLLVKAP